MNPEEPLDRLLSQTLRTGSTADVCPDAEQLAAFVESSLDRDDTAAMERHVSACARCAAIVSTIVASEPVTVSAAPGWRTWPVWGWAVPMVTAVAIAGLWFASTRRGDDNAEKPIVVASRDLGTESRETERVNRDGRVPAPELDRRASESKAAVSDLAKDRTTGAPSAGALAEAERPRPAAAPAAAAESPRPPELRDEPANRSADTAPAAARAEDARLQRPEAPLRTESEVQQTLKQEAAAPPPPSPPAARALDDVSAAAGARSANAAAADEQARVDAGTARSAAAAAPEAVAPPAAGAVARGGRGGGAGGGRGGGRAAGGAAGVTAGVGNGTGPAPQVSTSPARILVDGTTVQQFAPVILRNRSGTTQWRVRGLSVERSTDGGTTYAATYNAERPLTAGAVASDDTVWLVGEAGLVVHSTAQGWAVTAAPVAADLIDISEVTTRGATVRARDGREFVTEDGGTSWRQK